MRSFLCDPKPPVRQIPLYLSCLFVVYDLSSFGYDVCIGIVISEELINRLFAYFPLKEGLA